MLLGGAIGRFGGGGARGGFAPPNIHCVPTIGGTLSEVKHTMNTCSTSPACAVLTEVRDQDSIKTSPTMLGLPYTSKETKVPAPTSFELQTRLWEEQFLAMYREGELGNGSTLVAFLPELKPVQPIPCANYICQPGGDHIPP